MLAGTGGGDHPAGGEDAARASRRSTTAAQMPMMVLKSKSACERPASFHTARMTRRQPAEGALSWRDRSISELSERARGNPMLRRRPGPRTQGLRAPDIAQKIM